MDWTSALIGGGSALLGGILGSNKSAAAAKDVAKNAVSWRVADARRAGISPLVALGANVSQGNWQGVGSQLGAGVADAGAAIANKWGQRDADRRAEEAHAAQLRQSEAATARDLAEASFIAEQRDASVAARNRQAASPGDSFPAPVPQDQVVNEQGLVRGNELQFRAPLISGFLEDLGLPPWIIKMSGKSPSGQFYEDQYAEMGNILSFAKLLEDLGVDMSTISKLNPVGQALRTYGSWRARNEGKRIRDERRGRVSE